MLIYFESKNPTKEKMNVIIYGAGEAGIITKRTLDRDAAIKYSDLAIQIGANYPLKDGTGATGTWGINISGNAATVNTNANLTGVVTSVGNATSIPNGSITSAMLAVPYLARLVQMRSFNYLTQRQRDRRQTLFYRSLRDSLVAAIQ